MLRSLSLVFLLIAYLTFDSGASKSSEEIIEERYYVDDGCPNTHDEVDGSFQSKDSYKAFIRCCSNDGTSCKTVTTSCHDPTNAVTYDDAVSQCESENMRLCTKNELFTDVCCGTGAGCDKYAVWTSTGSELEWKKIAKTEPTCKDTEISKKTGISLKECKDFGNSTKNANFIWYGHQDKKSPLTVERGPAICVLYKECDLDTKARMPSRPGRTYKKNDSDIKKEWKEIARSESTCSSDEPYANRIVGKKGFTFEECIELANSNEKANFIWFAETDSIINIYKSDCILYKTCDMTKKAQYPERPGVTLEKKFTSDA